MGRSAANSASSASSESAPGDFTTSGGGVQVLTETFNSVTNNTVYQSGIATGGDWGVWAFTGTRWDQTVYGKAPTVRAGGTLV